MENNFAPCEVEWNGMLFSCTENAYQAAKNDLPIWHSLCIHESPFVIKKKSRTIPIRPDWDKLKIKIMIDLQEQKYSQEPYITLLLNTGNVEIVEGNTWGDKFWGVDLKTGKGDNRLGQIIMDVRKELRVLMKKE